MQLHPFNYPPHLPDFEDMDPDGVIEILKGVDEDGYQHLDYIYVGHYRNFKCSYPWRRTSEWQPRVENTEYTQADFAWALARILKNIHHTSDLESLKLGLTKKECGRILLMRDSALEKAEENVGG